MTDSPSPMPGKVALHQALHGYADGHQLLAASVTLTREQHWQMLVMSDLSGPAFRTGYETYLTGYPLETGGFYCLARTWFAPEMPRPGCVWTHSILVSDTDVAQITDFKALTSVFRRPHIGPEFDQYTTALRLDGSLTQSGERSLDPDISRALIYLLYGSPQQRIVLTTENPQPYEDAVLSIFSQQWPRLRRTFRFCTGALAIRDVYFDLAIGPHDVVRQDADKAFTIAAEDVRSLREHLREEWIQTAFDDLHHVDQQTTLRRFLWTFGPDYSETRGAFRPLCEVHLASSRSFRGVDEVLSALGHFFPSPETSRRLKASFFAVGGGLSASANGEESVLHALVTHPAAGCIPDDVASITERARMSLTSNPTAAIRIGVAASNVGGGRAEHYLEGLVSGLEAAPERLHLIPSSLLAELLRREPRLLAMPELWRTSSELHHVLLAQLSSLPDLERHGHAITTAILSAETWAMVASALARFGVAAMTAVLQWIDTIPGPVLGLPEPVLDGLREQRRLLVEVLAKGECGSSAVHVATALLDPRSDDVRGLAASVWVRATERDVRLADSEDELRSSACLLSLGMSIAGDEASRLVRAGFSTVYESAKADRLEDYLWGFVEPYLPWYLVTWDRCARLIRGVVRQFLDQHWATSEFLATFTTGEQFQRALQEADRTRRGARYTRNICEQVRSGLLTPDAVHSEVLARFCDSMDESSIPEL